MPTYEYECEACGHTFEKFQSMTARALRKCPECSKRKLQRLIGTGAGIIFKGSGFYETDYKRSGSSNDKSESKGEAKSESSASSSSADSKSDSGSGSKSESSASSSSSD